MLDIGIRLLTILLLLSRSLYWFVTGNVAKKEKSPTKVSFSLRGEISRLISWGFSLMIFLQLGKILVILPIAGNTLILQLAGLFICTIGIIICFWARYELGANWTYAADYQIKEKHNLITTGIYQYIRHPIYLGLILSWIGSEMVAQSYLCISFLALFFVFYIQGKREEKILLAHFGKGYRDYMKKTKMLIPFIV